MTMFSRIFPFSIHIVRGHSMQPFLDEGNRVVVFRWAYLFSKPKIGDVVVFRGSGKGYIKRIVAAKGGLFSVKGDNEKDSLKMSPIGKNSIIGRVIFSY